MKFSFLDFCEFLPLENNYMCDEKISLSEPELIIFVGDLIFQGFYKRFIERRVKYFK